MLISLSFIVVNFSNWVYCHESENNDYVSECHFGFPSFFGKMLPFTSFFFKLYILYRFHLFFFHFKINYLAVRGTKSIFYTKVLPFSFLIYLYISLIKSSIYNIAVCIINLTL